MSTSTTGTGTITLGSAENGYQSFTDAGVPDSDVVRYVIEDGADWEIGTGTYTSSGTTLSRSVTESSNADAPLNLSGNAIVFIGAAAQDFSPTITLSGDASGSVTLTDLEDATLTVTVADDSHNHVIANVDGLQADLDSKLDKSGGTMTGNLILNADPATALGAATKEYVDTIASAGIHYHDPVRVEKEGNLSVTYNNGTNGVGATLTNTGTQEALVIDSVTMVVADRVLVYEQSDATQNGVYVVTDIGSASTNWVLTRSSDTDTSGASDPDAFGKGDAFFVLEGAVGAGELYVMNTSGTIIFGTTDITFTQVASTAVYSAGTDLTLDGTTFNLNSTIAADTTGNAATATALETARTIGGVSFDGTSNVNLAGVNTTGNQDTTGNAATATAWETARTVTLSGDVSGTATGVDGSGNISITATVADDSHNHTIANVDGLQGALDAKAPTSSPTFSGNVTFPAGQAFDGRDVSVDGAKLDGIESGANVTDTANVTAAGALMDSEVTNLAQVKAFSSSDYATAAQGTTAGAALSRSGGQMTGNITMSGSQTVDGRDLSADGSKLDGIESGADVNPTASEILTSIKTVDGSGSGLDADTVDGLQASSFLRSDASDTLTGNLNINGSINAVDDIYLAATIYHEGDTDTYFNFVTNRINFVTGGTNRAIVDNDGVRLGDTGNGYFRPVSGGYGSIEIDGGAHSGWEGYSIGGRVVFMHDNSNTSGIYDDVNNEWMIKSDFNGSVALHHNGLNRIQTESSGVQVFGNLYTQGSVGEDYDALSGTSPTCNVDAGGAFSLTMSGNTTFTFSGADSGWSQGFVLQLTGNGSTVTWPSNVRWAGGTAPDAPASGAENLYVFYTRDGGAYWIGVLSSAAYA